MIKHVTNLEISIELNELGWDKETKFYWYDFGKDGWKIVESTVNQNTSIESNRVLKAPLATEVIEELPFNITIGVIAGSRQRHYLYIEKQ